MSFILDALRKSENERQRQAGPGFAELRPAMVRPTLPVWAIALAALLAVNLVVLAVVMLRNGDGGSSTAAVATPEVAGQSLDRAPVTSSPQQTAALPYTSIPERAPVSPAPEADEGIDDGADYNVEEPEAAGPELQPPPRARTRAPDEDESAAQLPTINDVAFAGTPLPELHLDIHVYATQPAERFVFLNNRKYREGSETPEGTLIERITRDGVVLNHRGVRFLLPRQ
jgi:general secretion pathway protein B